jgi:hypothetical protein
MPSGRYIHLPDTSTAFHYSFPVFSAGGLQNEPHTLIAATASHSLFIFDYAVYTSVKFPLVLIQRKLNWGRFDDGLAAVNGPNSIITTTNLGDPATTSIAATTTATSSHSNAGQESQDPSVSHTPTSTIINGSSPIIPSQNTTTAIVYITGGPTPDASPKSSHFRTLPIVLGITCAGVVLSLLAALAIFRIRKKRRATRPRLVDPYHLPQSISDADLPPYEELDPSSPALSSPRSNFKRR